MLQSGTFRSSPVAGTARPCNDGTRRPATAMSHMKLISIVKWMSPLGAGLALSACATDYVSQLSQPNFGRHGLHYTEENVDAALLQNGVYASKLMSGSTLGAFCLTNVCSQSAPLWSSRFTP